MQFPELLENTPFKNTGKKTFKECFFKRGGA